MGRNTSKLETQNNSSKQYQKSVLYNTKNKLVKKKVPPDTMVSYHLPITKFKALIQPSGQSHPMDVCHDGLKNTVPLQPVTLLRPIGSGKQVFSSNVRFLLFDLENQMNRTSRVMLDILGTLMGNQVVMVNDLKQFEHIISNEQLRIFLFTSSEYVDLFGRISDVIEKTFVLGTSSNPTHKKFNNIHDLIFQIAEELAQLYEEEARQHEKLGQFTLAQCKRETVNEMYRQLMDISTEDLTIDASICTDTSVVWLTRNRNTSNEGKLTQISPSLIVFDIEQACWNYAVQCGNETAIFLITDPSCNPSIATRLEELAQVKCVYRTEEFIDLDKLCFRLTHDLIKHYGQLGDQLTAEKRNQEARQMFLRAQQLCQILF